MKRSILSLFLVLAVAIAGSVSAQDVHTQSNLAEEFGLHPMHGKLQLKNQFTNQDDALAKYPFAWMHYSAIGWSKTKFMNLSAFDAASSEVVWRGQGGYPMTGPLNTTAGWECPEGAYWQTVIAEFGMGEYFGQGTGYVDNIPVSTKATRLIIWHDAWQGDSKERHQLQSGSWGRAGNLSYLESTRIHDITLDGAQKAAAGLKFNSSGLRLWRPGETSEFTRIRSDKHRDHGIEMFAPTPVHLGNITAFENVGDGIAGRGCWGGTISIDLISGDDNHRLVSSLHGNDNEGGGAWDIGAIKSEGCITSGRTCRFQEVAYFEGQFAVNIGVLSHVSAFEQASALIRVDSRLTDGRVQTCQVTVGAVKGKGYTYSLVDMASRTTWSNPGDWSAYEFAWNNGSPSGIYRSALPMTKGTDVPPVARRIILGPNESASTIYYDGVTLPPCTGWTTGPWSECVNGVRTRRAIPLPEGCSGVPPVPRPSEEENCSTTPPTAIKTFNNYKVTSSTHSLDLVLAEPVSRVVFTNLRLSAAPNYSAVAYAASGGLNYLSVYPDGAFHTPAGKCTSTTAVVAGKTYPFVEVVLPAPMQFRYMGTFPGQGGALKFTADRVELFP